jgi:hypothetical protein
MLLRQREDINLLGDGNCSVYKIISQLYPETYGGTDYVLMEKVMMKSIEQ